MSNPFVLNPSPDPFRQACNQGNLNAIKEYIKEKNPASFTLTMGLKHAAATDQIKVVRYFLENGEVITHNDPALLRWFLTKDTKAIPERALQVAASQASTEIVGILIEHGAQARDSMAMNYGPFGGDHDSRIGMMGHLLQHGIGVNNFGNAPGIRAGGTPLFVTADQSGLNLVAVRPRS